MRVEYINPFTEAAYNILVMGVAAMVGLAGDVEGRVLFDMKQETALKIASAMNSEELTQFDELVRATITELANLITAQAVTKLHDLGFRFDLTPPALFTGQNMEISNNDMEALIVPMEVPQGRIEINVAIRDRAN